jgi:hypothetical protein
MQLRMYTQVNNLRELETKIETELLRLHPDQKFSIHKIDIMAYRDDTQIVQVNYIVLDPNDTFHFPVYTLL